jgi:hypothetical protein
MLTNICLLWVGIKLNAPKWYYALLIIKVLITTLNSWLKAYTKGLEA